MGHFDENKNIFPTLKRSSLAESKAALLRPKGSLRGQLTTACLNIGQREEGQYGCHFY
jgi:hypothetical protein